MDSMCKQGCPTKVVRQKLLDLMVGV